MGGGPSEPATLVDLGWRVDQSCRSPEALARSGLGHGQLPASRTLAGISHVDDALVLSGVHCAAC
eukprot:8060005-Alexandrium_andersonii.AAC.1